MNLPNRLTVTRLCLVPVFIALYLCPYFTDISVPQIHILFTDISVIQLLAFIVFLGASLTDFLDGYLARKIILSLLLVSLWILLLIRCL